MWWLTAPVARLLTSIRTPSLAVPRASGGSCASRSAGRVKPMLTAGLLPGPGQTVLGPPRGTARWAGGR